MRNNKFLAALVATSALATAPVAIGAGGASATATPTRVKVGHFVQLRVTGLKPNEKIKATELIVVTNQKRTLYPRQRASSSGVVVVSVKAQVKSRHVWTFVGRTSHRKAKTSYIVK